MNVAAHADKQILSPERLKLGPGAHTVFLGGIVAAIAGLAVSAIVGRVSDSYGSFSRFFFAYLIAFAFYLSLALGALFFLLMGYLTRTAWSVGLRRVTESVAGTIPVLGILSIPIIIVVALQNGSLYRWALPMSAATPQAIAAAQKGEEEEAVEHVQPPADPGKAGEPEGNPQLVERGKLDSITLQKRKWLNPGFFILRVVVYFAVWSFLALWYRRQSLLQDQTRDWQITGELQAMSGVAMVILGVTLTFAAWDLFMSLDPHWFSTMWGVYYFAGSAVSFFATAIVIVAILKRAGYLQNVNVEHFHDLGKYLFGFTFFWGYIAFSQYMLLWYASIPEEVGWISRHGATTARGYMSGWTFVILAILFGQLIFPFAGLMSRHVKRFPPALIAWAVWVLCFHALDMYWIVMPEYGLWRPLMLVADIAAFIGLGGVFVAAVVRNLAPNNLVPVADPRLPESLAFHNI